MTGIGIIWIQFESPSILALSSVPLPRVLIGPSQHSMSFGQTVIDQEGLLCRRSHFGRLIGRWYRCIVGEHIVVFRQSDISQSIIRVLFYGLIKKFSGLFQRFLSALLPIKTPL